MLSRAWPGVAGCGGAGRVLTWKGMRTRMLPNGKRWKSNRPSMASTCPCSCVSPTSLRGHAVTSPPMSPPPPTSSPPRRSPQLGVALDGGAARGRLVAAVEAEGSPPTVHQQLVAVGVVTDDPGEDTDGHLLRVTGTQQGLLKVWEKKVPNLGWGASRLGGGPTWGEVPPGEGDGGSNPLTVEEVVARVELGELGHLWHRVAAGRCGADAGLGTRHACLPQPASTWDPLSG